MTVSNNSNSQNEHVSFTVWPFLPHQNETLDLATCRLNLGNKSCWHLGYRWKRNDMTIDSLLHLNESFPFSEVLKFSTLSLKSNITTERNLWVQETVEESLVQQKIMLKFSRKIRPCSIHSSSKTRAKFQENEFKKLRTMSNGAFQARWTLKSGSDSGSYEQ